MRYHPLTILFRLWQFMKNYFVPGFVLFVIKGNSTFWLFEYGRYAFLFYASVHLIYIILNWYMTTYEFQDNQSFKLKKGIFVRQTSIIPFNRIQNVSQRTTLFHRIFGVTSLTFETAMDGVDDEIKFEVLTKKQASWLMDIVKRVEKNHTRLPETESKETIRIAEVHFSPSRRDLWKASFTSLSFLAVIPIAVSLYDKLEPFLPDPERYEGMFFQIINNMWLSIIIMIVAVCLFIVAGMFRTFVRYGKYEISSDDTHIYIKQGILNEVFFTIEKKKIQGLEMKQPLIKRLFGLAEVKLISSANPDFGDDSVQVNSLYPFLPMDQAVELIKKLLPSYSFDQEMVRLPKVSLLVKLLKPGWLWVIASLILYFFNPSIFDLHIPWWVWSVILLMIMMVNRFLDYYHTRYAISGDQVQWWHGGFTSRLFITRRKNVIEVGFTQSFLQRMFHLVSIQTKNRSTPVHIEGVADVPLSFARTFHQWYRERKKEVKVQ